MFNKMIGLFVIIMSVVYGSNCNGAVSDESGEFVIAPDQCFGS